MSKKLWCFLGVHEMQIIDRGPYDKYFGDSLMASGNYFILQCKCCGTVKRKILCK